MHSRAGCQYQQQAINSSHYRPLFIFVLVFFNVFYIHIFVLFSAFLNIYFFFFSVTSPKAHLLNSRQKPCFYQWGPFKSAKPFCPWRWRRSIGTYESYHKQSQRLHISLPSQKLWIFKQFNFSGNKSSFGRQRNAQNTQHWHLNKLRGRKYSWLLHFAHSFLTINFGIVVFLHKTR